MTNPPQQRRRTRPAVEPTDHLPPSNEYDEDDQLSRQRLRQRDRRRQRARATKKRIVVDEIVHEPMFVIFVGQEYEIVPPKLNKILNSTDEGDGKAQMMEWVWDAFGDEIGDDVIDRIESDDDRAGWDELQDLMRQVMEFVSKSRGT